MDNLLPWLSLKSIPGIGNLLYKRLLDQFSTPENVLNGSLEDFKKVQGITHRIVSNIRNKKNFDWEKKELDLAATKNFRIITILNEEYPELLKEIPDPPPLLYINGKIDPSSVNIAIVGSRNASSYGISTSEKLGRELVSKGITIVSGMAIGVDTSAHKGALAGKGKTIAVLGSGLGKIYPKQNKNLFYEIAENGAVISEFPISEEPLPHNFPRRNRIISGISHGTIVVEAALKSGSLITARLAAEQNREVFAVPGNIRSFTSTGTHSLIKQGAKLVENGNDVIEELGYLMENQQEIKSSENCDFAKKIISNSDRLDNDEMKVYNLLEVYPKHIDEILRNLSMESGKLSSILLQLELSGVITQTPGKYYLIDEGNSE